METEIMAEAAAAATKPTGAILPTLLKPPDRRQMMLPMCPRNQMVASEALSLARMAAISAAMLRLCLIPQPALLMLPTLLRWPRLALEPSLASLKKALVKGMSAHIRSLLKGRFLMLHAPTTCRRIELLPY